MAEVMTELVLADAAAIFALFLYMIMFMLMSNTIFDVYACIITKPRKLKVSRKLFKRKLDAGLKVIQHVYKKNPKKIQI